MRAGTRKTLTIWWVVVLACMVVPVALSPLHEELSGLTAIAWFVGVGLMIVTLRKVEAGAHLQRPGWYRAVLVMQLVLALTGTLTAAGTVFTHGVPGLVTIATADLVAAVLTYKALVRPSPKLAIWSALFGNTIAFAALMVDISLDIHFTGIGHKSSLNHDVGAAIAMLSVLLQPVVASVVAVVVIRVFGDRTNLPDAKASLHPDHHDAV